MTASIIEQVGINKTVCCELSEIGSTNSTCNSNEEIFDQCLIQAIDEALTSLGEPVKNSIYMHLQNDFNIKKTEIPARIDEFLAIIHKIFGLGASRLEVRFIKNLNTKLKTNNNQADYGWSSWIELEMSCTECINNIKSCYSKSRQI